MMQVSNSPFGGRQCVETKLQPQSTDCSLSKLYVICTEGETIGTMGTCSDPGKIICALKLQVLI